ncbi:MAG: FAD-binding protein [Hyphomicrobiales bacterium]|nr:FAD-binding protein [Hyphomicrobiales bacterium]
MTRTIETDVVVIGGGAAGSHAALKVHADGLRVLLIVKGFLGRSGCSIFAGNLNINTVNPDEATISPEEEKKWLEVRAKYMGHFLLDQDYVKRGNRFTQTVFYPEMERKGLYIRRTDDGEFVASKSRAKNVWAPNQGFSGTFIMDILRKEILAQPIPLLQETMVTSLLMRDGEVVGVTALDIVRGEFIVIRAKSVIVATGPSNYLATRSTATREQCANGFAMAYRAGAQMQDLEIQWWHASDIAWPKSWMRLHIYPNPMPETAETVRLYNSDREMFFEQGMYPLAMQPYFLQLKHLCRNVTKGKADWHGGYSAGYTHIDPSLMERYSYQTQFLKHLGLDISKDLIRCGITWHMTLGGIRTNTETMETSLPGLYAAGGCGSHGVGSITLVSFDGTVAAANACDRARARELPELPREQVASEERRVLSRLCVQPENGVRPAEVKKRIRQIMWDKMGYIKNEQKMRDALADLAEVRETLVPRMGLETTSRTWNYDWVDALDVDDMLDICDVAISSSIERKESRGPFFREDFPFIDNKNCLKHTVVTRRESGLQIEHVPVKLNYIQPSVEREEFLSADY